MYTWQQDINWHMLRGAEVKTSRLAGWVHGRPAAEPSGWVGRAAVQLLPARLLPALPQLSAAAPLPRAGGRDSWLRTPRRKLLNDLGTGLER